MRPLFLVALIASISLAYVACGSPTPTQGAGQEPASETITDASTETPPDASEKAPESPAVEQGPEVTAQNCEMGKFYPCYSGDPALAGKGICRTGSRECLGDGKWGACNGAVGPGRETDECDGKDNDCDGEVDEGCSLPPGKPRIVEVMASPPDGGVWYVEIKNMSKGISLSPCELSMKGRFSVHNLVPLDGAPCSEVKPGGLFVVMASDYNHLANSYKVPQSAPLMKLKENGSLFATGADHAMVQLLYKGKVVEEIGIKDISESAGWPHKGRSLEKCEGDRPNRPEFWVSHPTEGTPGRANVATCP